MRKITIGMVILSIILIGMVIPAGFSGEANSVVITYGETTHANTDYKANVDSFFKSQTNMDLKNVAEKIITANDVNKISSTITGKYYNSNQIFSSALLDLNDNDNLEQIGQEAHYGRKNILHRIQHVSDDGIDKGLSLGKDGEQDRYRDKQLEKDD